MNNTNTIDTRTVAQIIEARRTIESLRDRLARIDLQRAAIDQFASLFV
jgi:hypothetical protein